MFKQVYFRKPCCFLTDITVIEYSKGVRLMEGFEIFIYIAFGATVLLVVASILLKKFIPEKKDKYLSISFYGLLIISIGIVIIGLFIGGWSGMGYGLIGASILVGTIIGRIINSVTSYFFGKQN